MKIRQTACLLLGIGLAANAGAMLAMPAAWYATLPGVSATGPLNLHFVRDIGCAYLVCGAAFIWLWRKPDAWPAAMAGSLFLALHAFVHVAETAAGQFDPHHLVSDIPGVFLLPVIAAWLAWPPTLHKENRDATMDGTAAPRRL